jgi:glycosyltransferase involved in cell wall biosynthesis
VNDSRPVLTVITVTRNAGGALDATMLSVTENKPSCVEYLIQDGLSTDDTLERAGNLASVDRIVSEKDRGIYDAMNRAAENARGEWICFLNAGDYHLPGAIARAVDILRRTDSPLVYGDVAVHAETGEYRYRQRVGRRFSADRVFFAGIPHLAMFYRREDFLLSGMFDTGYRVCADLDHALRMIGSGSKARRLGFTIGVYHLGGYSQSSGRYEEEMGFIRRRYGIKGPLGERVYQTIRQRLRRLLGKTRKDKESGE